MNCRKIIYEILIILTISAVTALAVNQVSSGGIAFFGNWDTSKGVISANIRNRMPDSRLEISDPGKAEKIHSRGEALFVDARRRDEFDEMHIKGAVSLPLDIFYDEIDRFASVYPADSFLVIYCSGRECGNSHELAELLKEEGYHNVKVFIDGFNWWRKEGFPVE